MDKPQQVLVGIAESHASADSCFKVRGRTGQIVGNHALILVPDVDHSVQLGTCGVHLVDVQEVVPIVLQVCELTLNLCRRVKARQNLSGWRLVDNAFGLPLRILRGLNIGEDEDELLGLTRLKSYFKVVRANRIPAGGDGIARNPGVRHNGLVPPILGTKECVAVRVESDDGLVDGVDGVVVAALAELCLVEDRAALDLNLRQGKIALVVGLVVLCVPQGKLHKANEVHSLGVVALIGERNHLDLGIALDRNEVQRRGPQAPTASGDARVAHAVTGFELVKFGLVGEVGGAPDISPIIDGEDTSPSVDGHIVVAVTQQAPHLGITVEGVAASGVGNEGEEVLGAQVVDPGVRGVWGGNNVLACCVVEVAVLHCSTFFTRALLTLAGRLATLYQN